MSAPLSPEDEAHYTSIIDAILATADLETVTRKKIRMGLEKALGGKDLSEQKSAIKSLIENRFDAISGNDKDSPPEMPPSSMPAEPEHSPKRKLNGHHAAPTSNDNEDEDEDDHDQDSGSHRHVSKKVKRGSPSTEDADAKLAARLQAQENQRARTTRGSSGSGAAKAAKKKKAPRKKKVRSADDSDAEGSEDAPKRKAGGGFQKPLNLSFALAEVCGEPQLSRPKVVKKLWEHIKANDLQDPKDKRQIICDDKMFAVFKQAKIDMFQMNKIIGNHLYPVDE